MEKYIGLDLGTTTLGVATSDALGFVHGIETFKFDANAYSHARKYVHDLVLKTGIKNIVLGLPLNKDGTEGEASKRTLIFKDKLLEEDPSLRIVLQDERFTTISAYRTLNELNVKGKNRKTSVDRLAACEILDFYLKTKGV